ncbi:MAG: zonular occludens toxin domain-containing protein [Clostridia bacterium]|nr:zonular occludens toxin domain-containing protein [Clostridia bacterium]
MIHNVFGGCGTGKSAFLGRLVSQLYWEHGQEIWDNSRRIIEEKNKKRKKKLTPPDRVPIYTVNFKIRIPLPDGGVYETYEIKGKEIGLGKGYRKFYPGSVIIVDEAQNEFNSKENLPRPVSAFFEKHRHARLEIWLAAQRPILINKDIRAITTHFIEIQKLEHKLNIFNEPYESCWTCREFDNNTAVEEYIEYDKSSTTKYEPNYKETTYRHRGNIFEIYDSYSCIDEYFPDEEEDFETKQKQAVSAA